MCGLEVGKLGLHNGVPVLGPWPAVGSTPKQGTWPQGREAPGCRLPFHSGPESSLSAFGIFRFCKNGVQGCEEHSVDN